jgi:hypothetical protein
MSCELHHSDIDYEYVFIATRNSPDTTISQLKSPFQLETYPQKWTDLDILIQEYALKELPALYFREDNKNLVAGTINLIDYIHSRKEQGSPVKTLVFLDKSARLGEYLLSVAYGQIKARYGTFGEEIAKEKPKIRFINVGRSEDSKHHDQNAHDELKKFYKRKDFIAGEVLIVDEYISSGGSVRRASDVFDKTNIVHNPAAIAQFRNLPKWYSNESVKGVQDVGNLSYTTREKLSQSEKEHKQLIDQVKLIIRKFGWNFLTQINLYNSWKPLETEPHLDEV